MEEPTNAGVRNSSCLPRSSNNQGCAFQHPRAVRSARDEGADQGEAVSTPRLGVFPPLQQQGAHLERPDAWESQQAVPTHCGGATALAHPPPPKLGTLSAITLQGITKNSKTKQKPPASIPSFASLASWQVPDWCIRPQSKATGQQLCWEGQQVPAASLPPPLQAS